MNNKTYAARFQQAHEQQNIRCKIPTRVQAGKLLKVAGLKSTWMPLLSRVLPP
jgi:hypothetical protein